MKYENCFFFHNFKVTEFRRMGGQSVPQAVRKILYRLLSNEVASLYSWEGAKHKTPLKNLLLAKCILGKCLDLFFIAVGANAPIICSKSYLLLQLAKKQ